MKIKNIVTGELSQSEIAMLGLFVSDEYKDTLIKLSQGVSNTQQYTPKELQELARAASEISNKMERLSNDLYNIAIVNSQEGESDQCTCSTDATSSKSNNTGNTSSESGSTDSTSSKVKETTGIELSLDDCIGLATIPLGLINLINSGKLDGARKFTTTNKK